MNINRIKNLEFDEIRKLYKNYLHNERISQATIDTAYYKTFYLWRKGNKDIFWEVVTSSDFENVAKNELKKNFLENFTKGELYIDSYMSHLRRFHRFIKLILTDENLSGENEKKKNEIIVPQPSAEQVEIYLKKWFDLENYKLQEDALDKLFLKLCPMNLNITDILIKISTLNDFYSTNIFSIYSVAKHILSLNIDARLKAGDVTLVRDVQYVNIANKQISFYSFATKYCSHHNPLDYPIFDSYVAQILKYFRNKDAFSEFKDDDLKDYVKFKCILIDFRSFYNLKKYNS